MRFAINFFIFLSIYPTGIFGGPKPTATASGKPTDGVTRGKCPGAKTHKGAKCIGEGKVEALAFMAQKTTWTVDGCADACGKLTPKINPTAPPKGAIMTAMKKCVC